MIEKVRWDKKKELYYILACRLEGGVPIFKTRYGGIRFPDHSMLAICWGGADMIPTVAFENVPDEELEKHEKEIGEWKSILFENAHLIKEDGELLAKAKRGEIDLKKALEVFKRVM